MSQSYHRPLFDNNSNQMPRNRNANHGSLITLIPGFLAIFLILYFIIPRSPKLTNVNTDNVAWQTGNFNNRTTQFNLDIKDITKVFQEAKGPQDFEQRINQLHTGNDIISIGVQDVNKSTQLVTLYIDKQPANGQAEDIEKIISLQRKVNPSTNEAMVNVQGYGNYSHYSATSPLLYTMSGMMLGSWMMRGRGYNTSMSRLSSIQQQRQSYRQGPIYQNHVKKNSRRPKWGAKATKKRSWFGQMKKQMKAPGSWMKKRSFRPFRMRRR